MDLKWRRVSLYLFVALCAGLLLANIAKSDSGPVDVESENGVDSATDGLSEEKEAASIQKEERAFRDKAEKFEFQVTRGRRRNIYVFVCVCAVDCRIE